MYPRAIQIGFTLIELMITLTLIGIISAFAVPAFRDVIISNSVAFGRDQFFSSLVYARSEAIKNGTAVTLCKSANGASCDNAVDWDEGWIVFEDANRDGVLDTGDKIVQRQGAMESSVAMAHGGGNLITFDSRGLTLRGDGEMEFSHSAGSKYDRSVDLGVTGRATKGK